jgi:hypothetical protein
MDPARTKARASVLEPTVDEMRAMMAAVSEFAVSVLEGIPHSRASTSDGAAQLARAPHCGAPTIPPRRGSGRAS